MPRWSAGRVALLGDAASGVSLVVLADALADHAGGLDAAFAAYEARLRPWAEAAQRTARRNANLFTPANRLQLLAREAVLRLAAWPLFAPLIKRLLNREGERLGSP